MNNSINPDVIYYNVDINTLDTSSSGSVSSSSGFPVDAQIAVTNNPPPIENPNEYYGSIVRLEVPCLNIPITQFIIQTPVTDVNKSIYSFTLTYGSTVGAQTFWTFVPEVLPPLLQPPPTGTTKQQFGPYYWLFDYTSVINIMNNALATAMTDLITLVPALAGTPNPYFYYDPTTTLITLYAPQNEFDPNVAPTPIKIYFNEAAGAKYMGGFVYSTLNFGNIQGLDNVLTIQNKNGHNIYTDPVSSVKYLMMSQDFVDLAYWSPLKEIILTSTINVQPQATYSSISDKPNSVDYESILFSFLPKISGDFEAGNSRRIYSFSAESLYRIFSITQKSPLVKMNLRVYWKDNLNNKYQFTLDPGQNIYIQIMFIKKSIFNWNMKLQH